jgi:hypothetical protein
LKRKAYKEPELRKIFIEDLIKLVRKEEINLNNLCVVMLDSNEAIDDKEELLRKLFRETSLLDVFALHTKQECNLPTYMRGTKRIDFILASANIMSYVEKVGYTAFYDASESDHRGAFMEISNKIIDAKVELQRPKRQDIGINSKKRDIYKYKQEVHREFLKKIYAEVDAIYNMSLEVNCSVETLESTISKVNKVITAEVLKAETNNASKYYESEWSIALHQQSLVCRYWSTIKRGMKNGRRMDKQTSKLYRQMNEENQNYLDSIFGDCSAFQTNQIMARESKQNMEIKRKLVRHHVIKIARDETTSRDKTKRRK